jgi:hypothetical protein
LAAMLARESTQWGDLIRQQKITAQ